MSAETQLNVFKQDLDNAVKDAHAALDRVQEKFELYLTKLEAENAPILPVVPPESVTPETSTVPEAPVASPKAEQPIKPSDTTPDPDPDPGTGTSISDSK